MAIKYDINGLDREMQRTVKNFNAKIRRLESKGMSNLPERTSMAQLKSDYSDRRELQRQLKRLQSFSNRGAEDLITTSGGVTLTKYELKNIKQDVARAKRNITLSLNVLDNGKKPRYDMMTNEKVTLLKIQQKSLHANINKMTKSEFGKFRIKVNKHIRKISQKEIFYENFFKMLFSDAFVAGVDKRVIDEIERKLRQLTPRQLYDLYSTSPELQSIVEVYNMFSSTIDLSSGDGTSTPSTGDFEADMRAIADGSALSDYDISVNNINDKIENISENVDTIIEDYKQREAMAKEERAQRREEHAKKKWAKMSAMDKAKNLFK